MVNLDRKWIRFLKEANIFDTDPLNLPFFEVHDELNPLLWSEDEQINPEIADVLKTIAEDFVENAEIGAPILDITITGSMANYNWTKYSDIDLHILINLRDIDSNIELVKKLVDNQRINWNLTHDIMVNDHEVEIYVQDMNEKHVSSGVYSLLRDKWIVKPTIDRPIVEFEPVRNKTDALIGKIDQIERLFHEERHYEAYDYAKRVKKKIKRMRQAGLQNGGIYSIENLAFKYLRNTNYLEKLSDLYNMSYDRMLSVE